MEQMRDAIIATFNKQVEDGAVQKALDKAVADTVSSMVSSAVRSYSDFGKALEKRLQEDLLARIDKINLHQYNDIVVQAIQERIDTVYVESAKEHLAKHLDEMFGRNSRVVKLSELVDMMKERYEEDAPGDGVECCSFHCNRSSSTSLAFIYMDTADDKESHECEYRLVVDTQDKILISAHRVDVYRKTRKPIRPDGVNSLHGLDNLLFNMVAWGTEIELDDAAVSTDYDWSDR